MNNSITNSEINSLGTMDAKFTALSNSLQNLYSTSENQGGRKIVLFTAVVQPSSQCQMKRKTPCLLLPPLPLLDIFFFDVTQFDV